MNLKKLTTTVLLATLLAGGVTVQPTIANNGNGNGNGQSCNSNNGHGNNAATDITLDDGTRIVGTYDPSNPGNSVGNHVTVYDSNGTEISFDSLSAAQIQELNTKAQDIELSGNGSGSSGNCGEDDSSSGDNTGSENNDGNYCSVGTTSTTSATDNIAVSIENPGVQTSQVSGDFFKIDFDDQSGTDVFTKTDTNTSITYTYEGGINVRDANQWGGADGSKYPTNVGQGCYRVRTSQDRQYFGFWWSAGDNHNRLVFKNDGEEVATFHTSDLVSFINRDNASNSDQYYGNPNGGYGQNGHLNEPFTYVNVFFYGDQAYDEIIFETTAEGPKFESDNHVFASKKDFRGSPIINEAPVSADDYATVYVNESVTIDVLENDTDINKDALTITSVDNVTGGTASIVNNEIIYQAGSQDGNFTLNYTVSDGEDTDEGTIYIEVKMFQD